MTTVHLVQFKLFIIAITVGEIDNSGMRFTITRTPTQFNAGVSGIGSQVNSNLFVPPNVDHFNIFGYCPATCTNSVRK